MNLAFGKNDPYIIPLICCIGWFILSYYDYKRLEKEKFKNFIYYLFAHPETPVQNFINSLFVIGFIGWIIKLIYTILYGFQT